MVDENKQEADQVGQQTGQSLNQAISDAILKALETHASSSGMSSIQDRMGDIGGTERLEKGSMDNSEISYLNAKRTYDEYQQLGLNDSKRERAHADAVNQIEIQTLQNAVETANMISKQAVRHGDVAIDRQWNLDEQALVLNEVLRSEVFKDAVAAAVSKAINSDE